MDTKKRRSLEAAGWTLGDSADFLRMSDDERQLLDARVELALAVRRQRESENLTQTELGQRLKTSQPRVAKIERAATDVSLDQLVRAFAAAGGKVVVKAGKGPATKRKLSKKTPRNSLILELEGN
jgi:predicted XRE-type DNA-binding protein